MEKPVTVLIAEDDRDQREILTEVFECEGYRVIGAASPKQTLERLSELPDVVLLDAHGASSEEVEKALTEMGEQRPVIIVVSGDARAGSLARKVSASRFIEKPYDLSELLAHVGQLTHRCVRYPVLSADVAVS